MVKGVMGSRQEIGRQGLSLDPQHRMDQQVQKDVSESSTAFLDEQILLSLLLTWVEHFLPRAMPGSLTLLRH